MAAEPFGKAAVMTACTIRPSLQWIKSPDSQANATLFLAKFYGRTGLLNVINADPQNFRHGLICLKSWAKCQAAVEAVLTGSLTKRSGDATSFHPNVPLKAGDISLASKDSLSVSHDLHNEKPQSRFKRFVIRPQPRDGSVVTESDTKSNLTSLAGVKHNVWGEVYPDGFDPGLSYDSWLSQEGHGNLRQGNESISSIVTLEAASTVNVAKHQPVLGSCIQIDDNDDCLNLTHGLPLARAHYALRT